MVHFKGEYLSWFLYVDSTLWRRNDKYYVWELKWKIKIEKYLINAMCKAAKQALTTHQYPLYCISVNNMISWDLMRVYPYIYGIYLYLYMRWLVMYEIPSHFIHLAKICFNCNVTFEIRADESSATIKTQTSYNWRLRWRRMQFELDRGDFRKRCLIERTFLSSLLTIGSYLDRSPSVFYFVPQKTHSQAGSTSHIGQTHYSGQPFFELECDKFPKIMMIFWSKNKFDTSVQARSSRMERRCQQQHVGTLAFILTAALPCLQATVSPGRFFCAQSFLSPRE